MGNVRMCGGKGDEHKILVGNSEGKRLLLLLLLLTALQPLVGFGLLYDFIPPSPISTFLPPISHFHLP